MSDAFEDAQEWQEPGIDLAAYRRQLARFGVFTGILAVLFALLVLLALAGRRPWREGLGAQVQQVLGPGYEVGEFEPVRSPFTVNCAVFALREAGGTDDDGDAPVPAEQDGGAQADAPAAEQDGAGEAGGSGGGVARRHAVIIRVATLYGPQAAVYVYGDGEPQARFVAFASLSGKAVRAVEDASRASQIAHWGRRIPRIVATVEGGRQ